MNHKGLCSFCVFDLCFYKYICTFVKRQKPKKYSPDLVVIEFMDLNNKISDIYKIEFYNQNINKILDSELYKYMTDNDYSLVNWTFLDLVWVSNKFREINS